MRTLRGTRPKHEELVDPRKSEREEGERSNMNRTKMQFPRETMGSLERRRKTKMPKKIQKRRNQKRKKGLGKSPKKRMSPRKRRNQKRRRKMKGPTKS